MSIHIGQLIYNKAKEKRIGATELAKKINTTRQNIYSIYKRKSIDTELLIKFCKILEYNFFKTYITEIENKKNIAQCLKGEEQKTSSQSVIKSMEDIIEYTRKTINEMYELNQTQKKITEFLKKKEKW